MCDFNKLNNIVTTPRIAMTRFRIVVRKLEESPSASAAGQPSAPEQLPVLVFGSSLVEERSFVFTSWLHGVGC